MSETRGVTYSGPLGEVEIPEANDLILEHGTSVQVPIELAERLVEQDGFDYTQTYAWDFSADELKAYAKTARLATIERLLEEESSDQGGKRSSVIKALEDRRSHLLQQRSDSDETPGEDESPPEAVQLSLPTTTGSSGPPSDGEE